MFGRFERFKILSLILILTSMKGDVAAESDENRVIIVGAGLAGFSAAAKLIENGIENLVILEAENRTGGRVFSIPFREDGMIDLGAQWVHGQNGNTIYEMINGTFEFGETRFDYVDLYFHLSNGSPLNQTHCSLLEALSLGIFVNHFREMATFRGSVGEFFDLKYSNALMAPEFGDIPWVLAVKMRDLMHNRMNNYMGSKTWYSISARLLANSVTATGKQWLTWRDKGFATVFDFITKKLPNPENHIDVQSKIQLNKVVTRVQWNQNRPVVTCADGSTYNADHVIFTPSLGVLKKHHSTIFNPALPTRKVQAINNIAFGTLEKMFLEFETPFWPVNSLDWVQYTILWSNEDIAAVRGTDREWLIEVKNVQKVYAFPNLLSVFLIGARFDDYESLDDTKLASDCMWLLKRVLQRNLPQPISVTRSKWITEPNFLGAYTYLSMDSAANNVFPEDLAETLFNADGKPTLFFAGEATAKMYSYAHGAVESGFRVGEEVLEFNGASEMRCNLFILLMAVVSVILWHKN